eukprot:8850014-Pyramimonas_sp.AAC.1
MRCWPPNYNNGSRLILPHDVFTIALSRGTSSQFPQESQSRATCLSNVLRRRAFDTQECVSRTFPSA